MNIVVNRPDNSCDVAIIGAGPYGLAAAAHLRAVNVSVRVFGEAMSFWRRHMPSGMKLRSPWIATHIADPVGRYRLDDYFGETACRCPSCCRSKIHRLRDLVSRPRRARSRYRTVVRVAPATAASHRPCRRRERIRQARRDGDRLLNHEYRPAQFDGLPCSPGQSLVRTYRFPRNFEDAASR